MTAANFHACILSTKPLATVSFVTTAALTTDSNTYTFSGVSLGTAASNRYVVVAYTGARTGGAGAPAFTSGSINGVSATSVLINSVGTNPYSTAGIMIAAVPSGTTGDIVVTLTETMVNMAIGVWAVYGLSSAAAVSTANSSAEPGSVNVNVAYGDILIAAGINSSGSSCTWTGATENYDATQESINYTGASAAITVAASPRTVTADFSASSAPTSTVSAVFR